MVTENGQSDGNTSFLRAARAGNLDKVLEYLKQNIDINTSNANGLNALHLASKDGHVEVVEELLKRGAVVDAATKKGNTALHIASLAGQEEVVKLLVQHGASVNVQSQNGFTPLYMAAQENHDNVVRYLLANGANQSLATEDGFTPVAVAMQQGHDKVVAVLLENDSRGKVRLPALHIAAKKDDIKAAKLLLDNDHNPDVTSKSAFTPLHIASHYGNEAVANLLIQKGADVNYAAKHNITPLHVAAKWGKVNMVSLLLDKGANIESKTRDGLTPLHCAARSGHEQVVDMLLERGAPISSKTKNGLAPLHMAAQGDHVEAARKLLSHRAPVDEVTVDYLTALHVAAHCGHVRVAKLLLDRGADANARALNGFTPLHIACKKNRIKVVELLLKHGASISATTESGLTPLHVASFMGCMNIVIYLLQHDANPDVPTVRGETPLHLAARANQTDIIRILLRNGAQVDARAREQQTPLHIASRLGNVDIVMLLLQHGAKVDTTTKDMYTALHIAAKEGQDEVAGVLIDNGASLNATSKKGFTPLHLAAKYGNIKVAKLLLQKEAPVDAQGKNGVTPLHVASHYDHQNVALLLLDKGASPHATAKNGHTPLHIAARKNQMDIANTLLEYGAHPNAESKAGFTPLHLSAQEGHTDMTSLLIEHQADTNHQARNGLTPLHLCAQEDRVPVAEILVKNGAEIDAATREGYTPLHIASHYGQANMVKFLLSHGANVKSTTSIGYTPLHQAAQQGHTNIVNILLENSAQPNAVTMNGQTPLHIAQKLGYISVIETLKVVTETTTITTVTTTEEKYRVVAPEGMHETFMSDSEEEGGEDTGLADHTYRYLTADEMKSLGDDSLPIDVTRDERIDSNRMVSSGDSNMLPPQTIEESFSPEHIHQNYVEYIKKYTPDNVDIARHPINIGFLVSFLVDARGGAMRGCRHSGVRVIVPPRCAASPTRITCRYVRPQRTPHPPPLMEGEALASRVLELGPVGAKFLGPVIIEVPHFAALRGKEREIVILRSDNGESWKEHTVEQADEILNDVLHDSFEADDLSQMEDISSGRITRIVTQDFPQYFAVVSRIRQEVHAIGPEGGMVSSTVVPQVQAVFPQGALTKKIKVGLQAQPIDPELTAKLLGHGVAVSPVVTVEPRRRKFHKAITLSMPAPRAHSQGMINQYSGSAPTLRLLCSITGGTSRAQWEDVTGSTPLTFVNDCVSFTTTVSARFWLMDCRNIGDATKMATELYREVIHVPFMAKFVVFAKRVDPLEARLRVFCMTDDKEDKTLEHQEHFTEVAKSRDVEVLEGKAQFIEFAGNLVPITKSGEQLQFSFRAFRENRLPFSVRVKDQHAEAIGRALFMREPKVPKGEPPQQPICILNIVLPDDIVSETVSLTDTDSLKKYNFFKENFDYCRPDPRLADMSNLLGEDWVPLATQLGLTMSEINVIKSEYPDSVAKQAQSMLRMWISQSGNKAQGDALENALRRIGREDILPQCLNVDQGIQSRIQKEDLGTYRVKKDVDEKSKKPDSFDKYSAEEKAVEETSDEEDFNKSVTERRQQIEKRLSVDRAIPASSQRVEIVQEISSIKEQGLVEDKIMEVEQKATPAPDSKAAGAPKTTLPSERAASDTGKAPSDEKTTTKVTTVISDSYTEIRPDSKERITHKMTETVTTDRRDSDLLEGVTHILESKKPVAKLIGTEDPKSPKFSKTPPPSPADFILREQAASIQDWEASQARPAVGEAGVKDAAHQGKPTPTEKRFVTNEVPPHEVENAFVVPDNDSVLRDSDVIDSKGKELLSHGSSKEDVSKEEDKKPKKGFFGTLKTFVSKKSLDYSDSDSEKSPKKEKKKRERRKKKGKSSPEGIPPEIPVRPPRKPKLPTPTEERKEFADIPFVEAVEVESHAQYQTSASIPVTDLDEVIDAQPKPAPKVKSTKVTVVEEVTKTFQPVVIQEADFSIVVDPTRKEPEKESKETITISIGDGIDKIEKEILEKSPIIPEESIKKPLVDDIDKPVRPPRFKHHVYEDIEEPAVTKPIDDVKKATTDLIQNEMQFQGWVDQEPQQAAEPTKLKRKEKGLFSFLSKKQSKESSDSEDDSQKHEIIEKQDRESSSEKKKEGGFLGLFGKKHKVDEIKEVDETPSLSQIELSEEVKQHMQQSDAFLQTEVDNYHDVKEIPQPVAKSVEETKEQPATEERVVSEKATQKKATPKSGRKSTVESEDESESTGFFGLFGKKSKKHEEKKPPQLSDEVIRDMDDTSAFIKEEVDRYHDARPIAAVTPQTVEVVHQTLTSPATDSDKSKLGTKEEGDDKKKSGVLGLFGKKTKKPEEEVKIQPLSEKVVKEMQDSDSFLREEVHRFHDVRPTVSEQKEILTELESTPKPEKHKVERKSTVESEDEDGKKGFFGLLGKKKKHDTEKPPPVISDEVLQNIQNTNSFLQDEVSRYHDVRPVVFEKEEKVVIKEEESAPKLDIKSDDEDEKKSGLFGIFGKKTKKQVDVKPVLSEQILKDMHDTTNFLKDEVDIYHDVRPVVPVEAIEQQETVADIKATPKSKKSKKDRRSGTESESDSEEKSGFFGIFGKKGKKEHHEPVPMVLPEETVKNMSDTNDFLKEEVKKYHDVRPIIPVEAAEQKDIVTDVKSTPKVKKSKSDRRSGTESESEDEERSGFFGLFGKKKKEELPIQPIILSEDVVKDMADTKHFINQEVQKYHDVRPVIANEVVEQEEIIVDIRATPKAKKAKKERFSGTESESEGEERKDTGLFGLFGKKKKEEASTKPIVLPEETVKNMSDTKDFIHQEVERYHDVRPVVPVEILEQKEIVSDMKSPPKAKKVKKGRSSEVESEGDEEKKDSGLFGLFGKKKKEQPLAKPVALSEETVRNMSDTKTFISQEVEKYHDVRPLIPQETAEEKEIVTDIQSTPKRKAKKFKKHTRSGTESESEGEEKKDSGLFGLFGKKKKEEPLAKPVVLSEDTVKNMSDTKDFIYQEVEKYHDVRPIIPPEVAEQKETVTDIQSTPKPKTKKSKKDRRSGTESESEGEEKKDSGLFGLFGKKKKEEPLTKPVVLSEETVRNMADTKDFIHQEVEVYQDVRPIILPEAVEQKETITEIQSTPITKTKKYKKDRRSGTESESEGEEKKDSGLFGLFGKKKKEEPLAKQVVLSEETVKNMSDTKDFIYQEVEKYHDVRPILLPEAAEQKETVSEIQSTPKTKTKKSKKDRRSGTESESDGEEKKDSGLFGLFGKKKKEEPLPKPVILSEETVKNMSDTKGFIYQEVEKYHDVRPIIPPEATEQKETVTEIQSTPKTKTKKSKKDRRSGTESESEGEEKKDSGLFGLFGKKKKDEPLAKPVALSEETFENMRDAKDFINQEVGNYHDVRPIIPREAAEQKETVTEIQSTPKTKTKKPKKDRRSATESESEGEERKDSGLFGLFGKKRTEEQLAKPVVLSEETVKDMSDTKDFIHQEVQKYHDVRPIIPSEIEKKEVIEQVEIVTDIQATPKPKKGKKAKKDKRSGTESESEGEEKKDVGLFGFFGKKKKKKKEEQETLPHTFSPETVKNMADTNDFINREVEIYHDVRPIIPSETAEQIVLKPDVEVVKEKAEQKEASVEPELEEESKRKSGLFNLFGKKPKKQDTLEKSEERQPIVLSEEVLKDMVDTTNFLQEEVQRFEDVRPIKSGNVVEEVLSPTKVEVEVGRAKGDRHSAAFSDEESEEKKKSGFLGIFSRKSKKEGDEYAKKIKKQESVSKAVGLSQDTIRNMIDTSEFLKGEVENYNDVRIVVDQAEDVTAAPPDVKQAVEDTEEDIEFASKSTGLFSIFSKKDTKGSPTTARKKHKKPKRSASEEKSAPKSSPRRKPTSDSEELDTESEVKPPRKSVGFFSKVGEKLSGKADDVKQTIREIEGDVTYQVEAQKDSLEVQVNGIKEGMEITQEEAEEIKRSAELEVDAIIAEAQQKLDAAQAEAERTIDELSKPLEETQQIQEVVSVTEKVDSVDTEITLPTGETFSVQTSVDIAPEAHVARGKKEKSPKKSVGFLGKIGGKLTGKEASKEEKRAAKVSRAKSSDEEVDKVAQKSTSFLGKIGKKIGSKEEDIEKGAKTAVTDITVTTDEMLTDIDTQQTKLTETSKSVLENVTEDAKRTKDAVQKAEVDISEVKEHIKKEVEDLQDDINRRSQALRDALEEDTEDFFETVSDTVSEKVQDVKADIVQNLEAKEDEVVEKTDKFFDTVEEQVTVDASIVKREAQDASQKGGKLVEDIGRDITAKSGDAVDSVIEDLLGAAKEADKRKEELQHTGKKLTEEAKRGVHDLSASAIQATESSTEVLSSAVEDAEDVGKQIEKKSKDRKSGFFGFFDKFGGKAKDTQEAVKKEAEKVEKECQEFPSDAAKAIDAEAKEIKGQVAAVKDEALQFTSGAEDQINQTEAKFADFAKEVEYKVSDTAAKIDTEAEKAQTQLVESAKAVESTVKGAKDVAKQKKKGVFGIFDKLGGKGKSAKEAVVAEAGAVTTDIQKQVDETAESMTKAKDDLVERGKAVGESFTEKVEGVKDDLSKGLDKAEGLKDSAAKGVEKKLDELATSGGNLKDAVETGTQIMEEKVKSVAFDIKETTAEKVGGVASDLKKAKESTEQHVEDQFKKAAKTMDEAARTAADSTIATADKAKDDIQGAAASAAKLAEDGKEKLESIAQEIKDDANRVQIQAATKAGEAIEESVDTVKEKAREAKETVDESLAGVLDDSKQKKKGVFGFFDKLGGKGKSAKEAIVAEPASISTDVQKQVDEKTESLTKAKDDLVERSKAIGETIHEKVEGARDDLSKACEKAEYLKDSAAKGVERKVDELATSGDKLQDDVETSAQIVGEKVKAVAFDIKDTTAEEASGVASDLKKAKESTQQQVEDQFGKVGKAVDEAVKTAADSTAATADKVKDGIRDAAGTATELAEDGKEKLENFVREIKDDASRVQIQAEAAAAKAGEAIEESVDKAKEKGQEAKETVDESLAGIREDAKQKKKGVFGFFDKLGGKGKSAKDAIGTEAVAISTDVQKQVDETAKSLTKTKDDLAEHSKAIGESIHEKVEGVKDDLSKACEKAADLKDSVVKSAEKKLDELATSSDKLKDDVKTASQAVGEKVKTVAFDVKDTTAEKVSGVASDLKNAKESTEQHVVDEFGKAIDEVAKTTADSTAAIADKAKHGIQYAASSAAELAGDGKEKLESMAKEIEDEARLVQIQAEAVATKSRKATEESVDKVKEKAQEVKDTVDESLAEVRDAAKQKKKGVFGFFDKLGGKGKSAKDAVVTEAVAVSTDIQKQVDKTAESVTKVQEDLTEVSKAAAESIQVEAVEVKDDLTKASDKAEDFKDSAVKGAEKKLDELAIFGDKLEDDMEIGAQAVEEKVKSVAFDLKDTTAEKVSDVASDLKKAKESTEQHAKDEFAKATKAVDENAKTVVYSTAATVDKAKDGIRDAAASAVKLAEDGKEKLESVAQEIKDDVNRVQIQTEAAAAKAGKAVEKSVDRAKAKAQQAKESVEESLEETRDKVKHKKKGVFGFFDKLGGKGKSAKEALVIEAGAVTADIQKHVDEAAESLAKSKDDFTERSKAIGESVHGNAEDVKDALSKTVDKAADFKDSLAKGTEKKLDEFSTSVGKVEESILRDTEKAKDHAELGAKAVGEKVKAVAFDIKDKTDEVVSGVVTELKETKESTKQYTQEEFGNVASTMDEIAKTAVDSTTATAVKAEEGVQAAAVTVLDVAKDGTTKLETVLEKVKDDTTYIKLQAEAAATEVGRTFEKSVDMAKERAQDAKDSVDESLAGTQEAVKQKKKGIFGFFDKIGGKGKAAKEGVAAQVSEIKSDVEETSKQGIEKLGYLAEHTGSEIKGATSAAKYDVEQAISSTVSELEEVKESGKQYIKDIPMKLSETGDEVSEHAKEAKQSIAAASEGIQEKAQTIGEIISETAQGAADFGAGLTDSVTDKAHKVADDVDKLLQSTVQKIAEFKDTGEKIPQKFEDSATKTAASTEKFINDEIQAAKDVAEKTSQQVSAAAFEISDPLRQKAEATKADLKQSVDETLKTGKSDAKTLVQSARVKGEDVKSSLTGTLSDLGKDVTQQIEQSVASTKKTTQSAIESVQEEGAQVVEGTKEVGAKVTTSVIDFEKQAQSKAQDFTALLEGLGEQAVDSTKKRPDKDHKDISNILQEEIDKISQAVTETPKEAELPVKKTLDEKEKEGGGLFGFFSILGGKGKEVVEETASSVGGVVSDTKVDAEQTATSVARGVLEEDIKKQSFLGEEAKRVTPDVLVSEISQKINEIQSGIQDLSKQSQVSTDPLDEVFRESSQTEPLSKKVKDEVSTFLATETISEMLPTTDKFSKMTRAVSDHSDAADKFMSGSQTGSRISEANIDLSNLPSSDDAYVPKKPVKVTISDSSPYVTSPTSQRRSVSQRWPKGERPELKDVTNMPLDLSSEDEDYVVIEPVEQSKFDKRKPLFHIASEDDESFDVSDKRRESIKSNVLETLGEQSIDTLLHTLDVPAEEADEKPEESSKSDVEALEQKLRDLDTALGSLEEAQEALNQTESVVLDDDKMERKLRRVERKFERMASEALDKEIAEAKQKLSTPELEQQQDSDFKRLVSQLSTEEVSDFQKEYSALWEDQTLSPSDEWNSKTPDSQADVQELPKGEIVYMGPVNLNKDTLINKAGIEVDVIPIMRSPCPSPKPKKKKSKRAKSEMGFHRKRKEKEEDRGSLPDLQRSKAIPMRGSILGTIMHLKPERFLSKSLETESTDSLMSSLLESEDYIARSLGSTESLSKGAITNAVVNWLQKSSPFGSTDNIERHSCCASLPDTMDTSMSIFDEEESMDSSGLHLERLDNSSRQDNVIPSIYVTDNEQEVKSHIRRQPCTVEQTPLGDGSWQTVTTTVTCAPGDVVPTTSRSPSQGTGTQQTGAQPKVADQHHLSEEMKQLLQELEKEAKK